MLPSGTTVCRRIRGYDKDSYKNGPFARSISFLHTVSLFAYERPFVPKMRQPDLFSSPFERSATFLHICAPLLTSPLTKVGRRQLCFFLCTIGTRIGTKPGQGLMTVGRLVSYTCNSEQRACCALVETWIAATFVNYAAPAEMLPGPESLKGHVVLLRTAFPALRFRVEELIADEECVAACVTFSGTHRRVFRDSPPLTSPVPGHRCIWSAL
jgi:hypothetical protein